MAVTYHSHFRTLPSPDISVFQYLLPAKPEDSPIRAWDPTLPAFVDGFTGFTLTRADLREHALRLATGIRSLGLKRGDVACLWGMNSIPWVVSAYGLMAAGLRITPANYAYETAEIVHQINDSESSVIFVEPSALPRLEAARKSFKSQIPDSRIVLLAHPDEIRGSGLKYASVYSLYGAPAEPERFDGQDSYETAWQCYSSGTTGLPKGVETMHHNLIAQLQGISELYQPLESGRDAILGILPMSHVYGLAILLMQPLTLGVPVIVLPKYEEHSVLTAVARFHITYAPVVPPIVLSLVNSPTVGKYDISSLNAFLSGAAPLSAELTAAFEAKFPHIAICQAYGMTETSPVITMMPTTVAKGKAGSCGRLLSSFSARLVDEEGNDAALGQPGELWLKGPCVMKGYWRNQEATKKTFNDSGEWFKTGDVVVIDEDGFYFIVDRSKELIKYKGFQVAPAELEALLLTHPKINDAGVIGVYDESQATELPRAYLVASPESGITHVDHHPRFTAEIKAWVAARVAPHKKLRGGIVVLDAIPKSPSGKILRKNLREQAKAELKDGIPQPARL